MEKNALKQILLNSLAAALLAGCSVWQTPPSAAPVSAVVTDNRGVLQLQPRLVNGGYAALSSVSPIIPANVDHLTVALFTVDGNGIEHVVLDNSGNPVTKDISHANLSNPITFNSLKMNTHYRVKASAYQAPGDAISDLISKPDSTLDVTVTNDDHPLVETLVVNLIDLPFSGQATVSTFVVNNGAYLASGTITVTPIESGVI